MTIELYIILAIIVIIGFIFFEEKIKKLLIFLQNVALKLSVFLIPYMGIAWLLYETQLFCNGDKSRGFECQISFLDSILAVIPFLFFLLCVIFLICPPLLLSLLSDDKD